ncbi:MAG: histidinol dehydrogenase [Planctomycetes bacterium]|nr:histidinol dehydrogenase [Planctomycetota bacterium]
MLRVLRTGEALGEEALGRVLGRAGRLLDEAALATVREVLRRVAAEGDRALLDLTERFDGVRLAPGRLRVSGAELDEARAAASGTFLDAVRLSRDRVRRYQEHVLGPEPRDLVCGGSCLGLALTPLARVGVYIPGGRAAYPSSVVMNVVPAQVAGVGGIAVATPPGRDGSVAPPVLAALAELGCREVFRVGGAQAVAALAFGTETIPAVQKVVGPGNAWVLAAKREVYGRVDVDLLAGPSEVLVIADASADPLHVALDLASQAEHDPQSSAVLVTPSETLARDVARRLEGVLADLPRADIARAALEGYGAAFVVRDLDEALALAERIAPEHLELVVRDPESLAGRVRSAGAVFLGPWTPEAVGDYVAGPSHTLPTGGSARAFSGLSVHSFLRRSARVRYDREALERDAPAILALARAEGLEAHALSVEVRLAAARTAGADRDPVAGLFLPHIVAMEGYVPGEQPAEEGIVKLNTNENPYPPPPAVLEALRRSVGDALRLYPDPRATALCRRLGEVLGVDPDGVVVGNGSDEILAMILRAAVGPLDPVAVPTPTYTLYRTLARSLDARLHELPFDEDYHLPAGAAGVPGRVFILANPNSPSGTVVPPGEVSALAAARSGLVVVDEAYVDFAEEGCLHLPRSHPNVIVVRTFSKSYSLAGVRLGFASMRPEVARQLEKVKDSYNVGRLAQAAGLAALGEVEAMRTTARRIAATRERLSAGLALRGYRVWPSSTNFVLARGAGDQRAVYLGLRARRVLVRWFDDPRLRDCLRVTVGTEAQVDRFLGALEGLA